MDLITKSTGTVPR